ncbi:DUF5058 family protein [Crystallibacter degradans]|uniref:DUF5058 family protein n=1 Tax=Crystallibacter degradans TaxID=2726743 RepID=UPI0014736156|nr:DUF5058 family protein [Arthrobacter sp. SF27]NMR29117.1 DUF5058 family protein [Arthrobacter sp. SF27]
MTYAPIAQQAVTTPGDVLAYANLPFLWLVAVGVFAVIIGQTVIYMRAVRKAAPAAEMSTGDISTSVRAGAISAIGPSLAVVVVAIAMLATLGTPGVLVRVGLIGSAKYEVGAASIAAGTAGGTFGGEGYTPEIFAIAFAAISLGGAMWLIGALVLTPLLKKGDVALSRTNPKLLSIIPAAAMLAAFFCLGFQQFVISSTHIFAYLGSAAGMALCIWLTRFTGKKWIAEWSQGIAIVAGLAVAYFITVAS